MSLMLNFGWWAGVSGWCVWGGVAGGEGGGSKISWLHRCSDSLEERIVGDWGKI